MTSQEINRKIAEVVGEPHIVPDYEVDDEMHDLIEALTDAEFEAFKFRLADVRLALRSPSRMPTALQKREAFLRVKGLWDE